MIRQFRSRSLGASHHLPPWCALLAPKPAPHFQLRLKLSPNPTQTATTPILSSLVLNSSPSSRRLSHHPNTIQFA
jgi:hypothetical protein